MNFIQQAIDSGFFVHTANKRKYNANDNWFGVSTYHPDAVFERGGKMIIMSLQGGGMPMPILTEEISKLLSKAQCKYICFMDNRNILYQTWTGEVPSQEFVDNFLKPE